MGTKRALKKILLFLFVFALLAGAALSAYYSFPITPLPDGTKADSVVVVKHKRTLDLYFEGDRIRSYKISLGREPKGDKRCQGDLKTPEGKYALDWKNPQSCCHLSIHVSYPDGTDRKEAAKAKCSPGGDIMIHGIPPKYSKVGRFHRFFDWTEGCIAVTNAEMDQIYKAISPGALIEIKP